MRKMTLGGILDFCIEAANRRARAENEQKKEKTAKKRASQEDINIFFGAPRKKKDKG